MKSRHFLMVFVLLAALGCQRKPPVVTLSAVMPSFSEVYALKDYHSDSAMQVMQRIADTFDVAGLRSHSPFLFNEYQVLKTELRFKNFLLVRDDTLTLKAFEFYDSVVSHSRAAERDEVLSYQFTRSLYYKAVVLSQQDRRAEAFVDFLRALRSIDELAGHRQAFRFKGYNSEYEHFTALVYDRLAWVFYLLDEWEESLKCLTLSNECFEKEGSPEGIASNFELMGDVMLAQGDRRAANDYYKKSDSIYESLGTDNIFHHHNELFHKALNYFIENKKDECNDLLVRALQNSEKESYFAKKIHFALGAFNLDCHRFDSAIYHYERSYPLLPRQTLKSYCNIIDLANALGDSTKAAHYGQLLADFTMQRFYQTTETAKMVTLFEEYKDEKIATIRRRQFFFIVGLILLLAVVVAVEAGWLFRRGRLSKADLEQHERIKTSLERQIAQTNAEAKLKEERIRTLQLELENAMANPDFQKLPLDEKLDVLFQIPLIKRALKVLDYNVKAGVAYPELVMSESHLGQLINAVDAVFPKFSVKMIEQYPRLKRSDVMYCCLYVLGLNEIQAAALTGKTYQAVWKRSTKLHEIFGNKSDIQFILYDILKNW